MSVWKKFAVRSRLLKAAIVLAVAGAMGFGGYWIHAKLSRNEAASCANCRSFMFWEFREYAGENGGWYPRGGKDPLDSLAKCVGAVREVHLFTSHAQAKGLREYWEKHKSFSADLCCYRYVEGLREDDPGGLVVLYYWKPTLWECNEHRRKELGRPVCQLPAAGSWDFIPEKEFQKKLTETLTYLRQQGRELTNGVANN